MDTTDSLQFVPIEEWGDLEKAFLSDWPRGIPASSALVTQKKLAELGLDYGFKVYRPRGGDITSGMVGFNKKGSLNEIIIQCSRNDTSLLEESLTNTKLIDWKSQIMVPFMPDNIQQCVVKVSKNNHLKLAAEDSVPNEMFLLNNKRSLFEVTGLPEDVIFKPLNEEDIDLVDSSWRNRHDGSAAILNMLIKAKHAYGLYLKEELVSWVFINEVGALTHLFTLQNHRKKGYGEMLMKQLCNICINEKRHIFAYCREGNTSACKLYEKLGFEKIHTADFNEIIIQCPRDDTTQLEEALLSTKRIKWTDPVIVPFLPEHMHSCIRRVAEKVGLNYDDHGNKYYIVFYGTDKSPFKNISLPEDIKFRQLSEENVDFINSYWVNRYASSQWFFRLLIKSNTSYGLFKNNELITWVFINEIGALSHLFTLEEHRKKGYAKVLMQLVCNAQLKENKHVLACCLGVNDSALKLYDNLGFEKMHTVQWMYLTPKVDKK